MEHIPLSESDEEKNRREYAAFCRYCGLLLSDGMMIWRDSLKTAGLTDRAIAVKLAVAEALIRRQGGSSGS